MQFPDEVYIVKAVEQRIVSGRDAIALFRCGHLVGLDAIKHLFVLRERQVVQVPPRTNKLLFSNTIEKLTSGYYNGRSLDSIICESTRFLGERYALYHAVMSANTQWTPILSCDKLYALPDFRMRDVDSCDPRFEFYNELFASFSERRVAMPRSREDIQCFLKDASVRRHVEQSEDGADERRFLVPEFSYRCPYDLDMVISYLVRRNLL